MTLLTTAVPHPTFANHESFHLRHTWLKKAYNAVSDDPEIFTRKDATIRLGVGKNMVSAIRFWSISSKILEPGTKSTLQHTQIGEAIFKDGGLDPYSGHLQTAWLLHWLLLVQPCRIPVWWIIMNEFSGTNVNTKEIYEYVTRRIFNIAEWKTPARSSIEKDIDVFLHTYSTYQGKLSMEDYLDCPFRELDLVRQSTKKSVRFVHGLKDGISPLIAAFACLDYIKKLGTSSKSISVGRLAMEQGSVGQIFKLNESDLAGLLKKASEITKVIRMENVNGSYHMIYDDIEKAVEITLGRAYGVSRFKMPKKRQETKH